MTPIYLNRSSSTFPFVEPNEDHQHLQLYSPPPAQPSSLSCAIFFNPTQDQEGCSYRESLVQRHQQEVDPWISYGGSSAHQSLPSPSLPIVENNSDDGLKFSICKLEDKEDNQTDNGSIKWMSSKMRLMRKFMNTDQRSANKQLRTTPKFQDQQRQLSPFDTDHSSNNSSSNSNSTVRVCSDCNTTKTPLWRSGPQGPKSLCNACGIRQRKARRAMAAAAAAEAGTILATGTSSMRSKVHHKEKKSDNGYVLPYKKRCKLTGPPHSRKKLCFEDFTISLSKNLAFHQAFPQDEKEAAILLMALSCGLVHG